MKIRSLAQVVGVVIAGALPACSSSTNNDCVPDTTSSGDVPITAGAQGPDGGPPQCPDVCRSLFSTVTACAIGASDGGTVAHCTWLTPAHCGKLE